MGAKTAGTTQKTSAQEVCIDLPGERVQCWRSSDKVKVILRKHRDVIFDINLKAGTIYTVESTSEFYSPREKKILKKTNFFDGERFHIWVPREFKDWLVLTCNGAVLGQYKVLELDSARYGANPKEKPEPLMVILGTKAQVPFQTGEGTDSLRVKQNHLDIFEALQPKLPVLSTVSGTRFDYSYPIEPPEIKEYVVVAEIKPEEIRPDVLKQLKSGSVTGKPSELFSTTAQNNPDSHLYKAIGAVASVIAGNEFLTSTPFKESAGYAQEHFKALDKILMTVRIEEKAIGKYAAVMKGKPLSLIATSLAAGKAIKTVHRTIPLGSKSTSFIDGGFGRTGRAGYGGARRIMLTAAENFKSGMKIQIIGTVIDIFVDANSVFFDEKGSKDLSEFLGRAGVSIVKAGMTAAMGSVIAAGGMMVATAAAGAAGLAAAPVVAVVVVVVGGYILAAYLVDKLDSSLNIKENVAQFAR